MHLAHATEYYGGPFFNNDDMHAECPRFFKAANQEDFVPHSRSLKGEVPECITLEDADALIKFMRRMLSWTPEDRATAKELKNDPQIDGAV